MVGLVANKMAKRQNRDIFCGRFWKIEFEENRRKSKALNRNLKFAYVVPFNPIFNMALDGR
jgi:hypothetical protein